MNINEFLQKYDNGDFSSPDMQTQIEAGWYDWFCRDSSLKTKTDALVKKLKQIAISPKINPNNNYVFFKNNYPGMGTLYDDFRICSIKTGEVLYTIIPKSGHRTDQGMSQIYGYENAFKRPLIEGSWKNVVKWFNT